MDEPKGEEVANDGVGVAEGGGSEGVDENEEEAWCRNEDGGEAKEGVDQAGSDGLRGVELNEL